MRLAVIGSSDSWYFSDLRRAAARRHQLTDVSFSRLASFWDGSHLRITCDSRDLNTFDAVLVRSMPPGSLEQVVFRMDVLSRLRGPVVVNPPRSIETAVDKYLATAKLAEAGLSSPRTVACQTVDDAMAAFDQLGGDVVVKPLFGGEGRGITRISDEEIAFRAFKALVQIKAIFYLQEFILHDGSDLRLLVIGDRVLGMRRVNRDDWRTNISRGAIAEPFRVDEQTSRLASSAAQVVGASLAGVDVLTARDGNRYVLEVNAVPGWRTLAKTLATDVASLVLDHLELLVEQAATHGKD